MKKIFKLMCVSIALCGCVALNSCKDNKSYVDNSYKVGDNKTMSKILEEFSSKNYKANENQLESADFREFSSVKQYSNYEVVNGAAYKQTTSDGVNYYKFSDLMNIDTTDANFGYTSDSYGNSYAFVTKETDKKYNGSITIDYYYVSNPTIYKTTIYGHIINNGVFDFELDLYSTNSNVNASNIKIYYVNKTLYIENSGLTYHVMSFDENMSSSSRIQLSKEITNLDSEDKEDVDYDKIYKYAGYTYDEDINQYTKVVNYDNYNIVYHKDEKGKDLPAITYNKKAWTNKTLYIWQEDTIIAEKNDTDFTYFDGNGQKHLVKTYYSNLADGTNFKEIETKIIFTTYKGLSNNYFALQGYEVDDDEEILNNNLKTYFLNNSGKVVYTTTLNLDYSKTIKVSDNTYLIGNMLFDSSLNYIDTAEYSDVLNAFVASNAVYDIAGNVIASADEYSIKNNAIYSTKNDKYYSVVDQKLVEFKGDYLDNNLRYNLDIKVTELDDMYMYVINSMDGRVSTTFYAEDKLTFSFNEYSSFVRLTANKTIYADLAKENKIGFILFNI